VSSFGTIRNRKAAEVCAFLRARVSEKSQNPCKHRPASFFLMRAYYPAKVVGGSRKPSKLASASLFGTDSEQIALTARF
jgi:hypothetical protein